jgi:hypothetical protein
LLADGLSSEETMAELATRTNAQIRRSKRWRLAVIFAVAAAILSISLYVTRRHNDDIKAAQSDAAVVANQLPGQVAALDINAVFAAISADRVNGLPQNDFPGRPDIPGAELTQAPADLPDLQPRPRHLCHILTHRNQQLGQYIDRALPRRMRRLASSVA